MTLLKIAGMLGECLAVLGHIKERNLLKDNDFLLDEINRILDEHKGNSKQAMDDSPIFDGSNPMRPVEVEQ